MKEKKYQIKVNYQTGDSFNTTDTSDIIEISWDNLDIAKANLKRIKEHYIQHKECNRITWLEKEKIFKKNQNKDWFVKELKPFLKHGDGLHDYNCIDKSQVKKFQKEGKEIVYFHDDYKAKNCMILYTDDNTFFQINCYWCGYFETLYGAEIINADNDLKFEI